MIAVSRRYGGVVTALALGSALPIWFHALVRPTQDPCSDIGALFESERIGGLPARERLVPEEEPAGAFTLDGGVEHLPRNVFDLAFRVQRSFEPGEFYGLDLPRRFGAVYFLDRPVERVHLGEGEERIPVWWIEGTHDGIFQLRTHLMILDLEPAEGLLRAGFARAFSQLFGGTLPVTMFAFRGEGTSEQAASIRDSARLWMLRAWSDYTLLCAPGHDR